MNYKRNMLARIRGLLAMLFFFGTTLLFLDFTGTIHVWLGWMAKIQFLPALLALNVGVMLLLIVLTLLVGRVYCSVICPLGVMQDVVSWISGRRKKKKYRFSYSPEVKWLRYGVLGLFIIAIVAGVGSFVALLAPYSSYGRIASNLFAPLYQWGNNLLAYYAERAGSYAFYETEVWIKSLPTFIIAALTFIIMEHLQDNIRTFAPLDPCTDEEFALLEDMAQTMLKYPSVPCTACQYCMPCPYGLDIPGIFAHYNKCINEGNVPASSQDENYRKARRAFLIGYDRSVPRLRQANHCIGCNQCVHHCPQNIDIPAQMQRIDHFVEQLKQGKL